MRLIIPGQDIDLSICSLCDRSAIGIMIVLMMVTAKEIEGVELPERMIQSEVEVSVCEQHSKLMVISLEKRLKARPQRIFTF